jgi:hypothetical protein
MNSHNRIALIPDSLISAHNEEQEHDKVPLAVHFFSKFMPLRWVIPDRMNRLGLSQPGKSPLNITSWLTELCIDIVKRAAVFQHIDMSKVLVSFTSSKTNSKYGLQARLTPLRLENGSTVIKKRGSQYQVQKYTLDQQEMLYIVTFCMPRFLDLPAQEKLITVFHELYHIGEKFDGDIRRHAGRCHVHTGSKAGYDAHMGKLVDEYLANHPQQASFNWLNMNYEQLWLKHEGVFGVVIPRPRLIPIRAN